VRSGRGGGGGGGGDDGGQVVVVTAAAAEVAAGVTMEAAARSPSWNDKYYFDHKSIWKRGIN
jgi:hypothetical protein